MGQDQDTGRTGAHTAENADKDTPGQPADRTAFKASTGILSTIALPNAGGLWGGVGGGDSGSEKGTAHKNEGYFTGLIDLGDTQGAPVQPPTFMAEGIKRMMVQANDAPRSEEGPSKAVASDTDGAALGEPAQYFDQVILVRDSGFPVLSFTLASPRKAMPAAANTLYGQISNAEQTVRELVAPGQVQDHLMRELTGIAYRGLVGAHPDVAAATSDLDGFRQNLLLPHLQRFRDRYAVRNTGLMAGAVLAALLLILWLASREAEVIAFLAGAGEGTIVFGAATAETVVSCIAAFLFGMVGFAVGEVFTGFRSAQTVDLASYRNHPRFRLGPLLRLFYGASAWFVALAFLTLDWIIIGVGGTTINAATKGTPLLGLVGGIVIAIAFDGIVDLLSRKSKAATVQPDPD